MKKLILIAAIVLSFSAHGQGDVENKIQQHRSLYLTNGKQYYGIQPTKTPEQVAHERVEDEVVAKNFCSVMKREEDFAGCVNVIFERLQAQRE